MDTKNIKIKNLRVPIISVPDLPIQSTSQKQLPIADIIDDIALFKDGGACLVLESTSLNFGLLSEKEQEAVVAAYAALINSLTFSAQILIKSQRKDITSYLKYLDESFTKLQNPKLVGVAKAYKKFITETVKKKNVLGKRFFVIIPFSPLELGVAKSFATFIKTNSEKPLPFAKSYVLKKAKLILIPRRDHLTRQARRLGLRLKQLTNQQLIELYFDVYNPKPPAKKQAEEASVAIQTKN
ncbi:MAG: hypothetical protein AAB546_00455 [Patescibacteria group bacterium]